MVLELRKESQVNAFHRLRINIDNFASTGKIEVTMMRGGDELRLHHLTYARNRITALPSGLRIMAHQGGMRFIQLPHTSVRGMINKMFLRLTGEILLPHAERPLPVFRSNRNGINLIILSYIVGTRSLQLYHILAQLIIERIDILSGIYQRLDTDASIL